MERPYKVIGYPFTPGLLTAISAYLVIDSVRNEPWSAITAIVLSVAPMALFPLIFKEGQEEEEVATEMGEFSGLHEGESDDEENTDKNVLQKSDQVGLTSDEETREHATM